MEDATFEYFEVKIEFSKLREVLTSSELAALSISSYCANDVNNFTKLARMSNWQVTSEGVADWLKLSQEISILRALTIRLFEFWSFVEKCRNQNGEVGETARMVLEKFFWIKNSIGYEVAETLRDKAIAHTSLKDVKKALKNINAEAEILSAANRESINSFYSLGEEVLIFAQIRALEDDFHSSSDLLECWLDWAKNASSALLIFHVSLQERLVLDRLPSTEVISRQVYFPRSLVADCGREQQLPVFLMNVNS
ncbi:hypothetical protein GI582_13095 [Sulfitobacter sp. BDSS02]|nr:hypothetical protein [Sulfitobacter sp. BDSS02]MBR9848851.1 hypothetical protein [Paracoccaceae bacterium]